MSDVKRFVYIDFTTGIIEMPSDAPNPSPYPPYVLASDYAALGADFHRCRDELDAIGRHSVKANARAAALEVSMHAVFDMLRPRPMDDWTHAARDAYYIAKNALADFAEPQS